MTKKTLIGVLALALAFIGAGCNSSNNNNTTLVAPTVTATGTNGGATLHLSWGDVTGATSYEITAGDSIYTTTSTSFDVTKPVTTIAVKSVNGSTKSDSAAKIACAIVETTVDFFSDLDTSHANGFGFNGNGSVSTYSLYAGNLSSLDFYAESSHAVTSLYSAAGVNANKKGNIMKAASGNYDSLLMADTLGAYVKTPMVIMADSTYYLRVSADTAGTWSNQDHFAKASVVAIDSAKVTMKLGYQPVPGIRWLIK